MQIGEWGRDILTLIGAVILIVGLLQCRAVLACPVHAWRVRRLQAGTRPPAALADLYAKAHIELTALGFVGPHWVLLTPEPAAPGTVAMMVVVFCHSQRGTLVVLGPPLELEAPNALNTLFITHLQDGRELTSQVRNIYSEAVADDVSLAQTIDGATLAEQWRQHWRWRKGFRVPAAAGFGAVETLDSVLQSLKNDAARLLKEGSLWRDTQGVARPTLRFALYFLKLFWTRPRPQGNALPVPISRLELLASLHERWRQRVLPVRWQWALLVFSSVLFAALGAVFWDLTLALLILGVTALHEGGHYLAMRAFGYRQVQMLALPLLGGVTLGVEQHPSAYRRAWMVMMGPLPGIVLGWALWCMLPFLPTAMFTTTLWLVVLLLAINYFNLLPVPPLDGGRLVQTVLPPRWHLASVAFVVMGCVLGAAVAGFFGIYLLVLLALLQLTSVPALLTQGRIVRVLSATSAFQQASRPARWRSVLETLQQFAGPTTKARARIEHAEQAMLALEQPPITPEQRAIVSAVYGGLWLLPLFFLGAMLFRLISEIDGMALEETGSSRQDVAQQTQAHIQAQEAKQRQRQQHTFLALGGLSVPQLLARMPKDKPAETASDGGSWSFWKATPTPVETLSGPADPVAMATVQSRLGVVLPGDYTALLAVHDGYPALQLLPAAQLQRLSETDFPREESASTPQTFYSFAFPPSSFEGSAENTGALPGQRRWHEEELRDCVMIGGIVAAATAAPASAMPTLLWCPGPAFEQARIVSLAESLWAPDFSTYLRYAVTQAIIRVEMQRDF